MTSYFVTLLSSENYLDGILCLNQNLLNVASKYPLLCVVSDDVAIDGNVTGSDYPSGEETGEDSCLEKPIPTDIRY